MKYEEIVNELNQGICEITWTNSHSVEFSAMGTLSTNHLNEDVPNLGEKKRSSVAFWDVCAEEWIEVSTIRIVEIERLTGIGVKDDVDKVNIDSMEEFLYDEYYDGNKNSKRM